MLFQLIKIEPKIISQNNQEWLSYFTHVDVLTIALINYKLEDTKVGIRIRKSKDRQHNDQKEKGQKDKRLSTNKKNGIPWQCTMIWNICEKYLCTTQTYKISIKFKNGFRSILQQSYSLSYICGSHFSHA